MIAHFYLDEHKHIEWALYPKDEENSFTLPLRQRIPYSLVQAKLWRDAYDKNFSNGITMFNSETARKMFFVGQSKQEDAKQVVLITTLQDQHHNLYHQYIKWRKNQRRLVLWSDFKNCQAEPVRLEYLTSFVLNSLSPLEAKNIPGNLQVIRMRSKWAMEGRTEKRPLEDFDLEESWKPSGLALLSFGQNGTMPVRRFFPFLGVKDEKADVTWLAEFDGRASWQMNLARVDDRLVVFGGLPDRDNGHWYKDVKPGETYTTPCSYLTTDHGSLLQVSRNLKKIVKRENLPVVYNEWGTSWGHPSAKLIEESLPLLKKHRVAYYVIDAGWYESVDADTDRCLGDWAVNKKAFPQGLREITAKIHQAGMKAGIWYEFEGLGNLSKNYHRQELLAKRDSWPVTTMKRRFLDLRKPIVLQHLKKVFFEPLIKNNFDYLKVDYNDNLGIGIDGADSPAQGIQEEVSATLKIFRKLRQAMPQLKIESCSSGGHRLVPAFVENSDFSSFSDAHETKSIPIIAANELNILPTTKNLIWCVVHPQDQIRKLEYHLLASFLGRICLSGDIRHLSAKQWKTIDQGLSFYQQNAALISAGFAFRFGPNILSYRSPVGYQLVGFSDQKEIKDSHKILLIVHQFAGQQKQRVSLPFDFHGWQVKKAFGKKDIKLNLLPAEISLSSADFSAKAYFLEKKS